MVVEQHRWGNSGAFCDGPAVVWMFIIRRPPGVGVVFDCLVLLLLCFWVFFLWFSLFLVELWFLLVFKSFLAKSYQTNWLLAYRTGRTPLLRLFAFLKTSLTRGPSREKPSVSLPSLRSGMPWGSQRLTKETGPKEGPKEHHYQGSQTKSFAPWSLQPFLCFSKRKTWKEGMLAKPNRPPNGTENHRSTGDRLPSRWVRWVHKQPRISRNATESLWEVSAFPKNW